MTNLLEFSKVNSKLEKNIEFKTKLYNIIYNTNIDKLKIYSFSLPAGYSCPFANECKSFANKETGKIQDTKETKFRCFEASMESAYKNLRLKNWRNFDKLKKLSYLEMYELINSSIPKDANIIRIHVGGDYFNKSYAKAWLKVASNNPKIHFYGYTKSFSYFQDRKLPSNFNLTYSIGSKLDKNIRPIKDKISLVVTSFEQAIEENLIIDFDDSQAMFGYKSFALVIHGTQPKGSYEGKQAYKLRLKKKAIEDKIQAYLIEKQNDLLKYYQGS